MLIQQALPRGVYSKSSKPGFIVRSNDAVTANPLSYPPQPPGCASSTDALSEEIPTILEDDVVSFDTSCLRISARVKGANCETEQRGRLSRIAKRQ